MIANIKLTKNDKQLLKRMKNNYECEISINPKVGLYLLKGDNFQILSVIQFMLIKLLETDVKLSDTEREVLNCGFDILKRYLNKEEKENG